MVFANKPVTNPALISAIKQMYEKDTQVSRNKFKNEIMQAHFLAPVIFSSQPDATDKNSEVVLKKETVISFNTIENTEKKKFFLAFTDWSELRKWQNIEKQQTLIVTYNDLSSMIIKDEKAEGFVINPYVENVIITRLIMESFKGSNEYIPKPIVAPKDTTVELGPPKEYPQALINAIVSQLKNMKNVKAAYLQLMKKDGESSYLVVVDFTGDQKAVFDTISRAAVPLLKNMYLDLVPLSSEFGCNSVMNVKPFYKKKILGLF